MRGRQPSFDVDQGPAGHRWRWPRFALVLAAILVAAAVGSAGTLAAAGTARGGMHRAASARMRAHRMARLAAVQSCWSGGSEASLPAPPSYDLGPSFAGLPETYTAEECAPDPRQTFDTTNMPGDTNTVPYFFAAYGTCDATSEEGCAPPVEIEIWPICADNMSGNPATGGYDDQPVATQTLGSLLAGLNQTVTAAANQSATGGAAGSLAATVNENALTGAAGGIPVARYGGSDDDDSMEVYVGSTAIRIFASDPNVEEQATAELGARALVSLAGQRAPLTDLAIHANGGGCGA